MKIALGQMKISKNINENLKKQYHSLKKLVKIMQI